MQNRILLLALAMIFGNMRIMAQTDSFIVDGVYRSFIVHLPTGYSASTAYPLVLNLHGYTSNAVQEQFYSKMNVSADANHYIVVYPDGIANYWNSWGPPGATYGANDIKFLSELIDTISARYHVAANRIYSCGMSNGGYMSYTLACNITDRLAAIASVSGTMSNYTYSNCNVSRKIPVMHIHGTSDMTVPYATGATGSIGVEQTIAFWRDTNDCQMTSDTTDLPNTNTTDGCTVQKIHYAHCNRSEVLFYKITGGGHTWPSGAIDIPSFGNTDHDISATDEIWNFFSKYTLDGPAGIDETEADVAVSIYPNPCTTTLHINTDAEIKNTDIYDLSGRKIVSSSTEKTLNTSILKAGMYVVNITQKDGKTIVRKVVKE